MSKSKNRVQRQLNNKILIVCGGSTEEIYFNKFNSDLAEISIDAKLKDKNPKQIVEYAIELKKVKLYRMIWCVFDKDQFNDFDDAIVLAEQNNIRCAFSNQAFELWFILHYQRNDACLNRTKYKSILTNKIGRVYKKTDKNMYSTLKGKMREAINNAKIGHQLHKANGGQPSEWESCTNVYELVSELLKWSKCC